MTEKDKRKAKNQALPFTNWTGWTAPGLGPKRFVGLELEFDRHDSTRWGNHSAAFKHKWGLVRGSDGSVDIELNAPPCQGAALGYLMADLQPVIQDWSVDKYASRSVSMNSIYPDRAGTFVAETIQVGTHAHVSITDDDIGPLYYAGLLVERAVYDLFPERMLSGFACPLPVDGDYYIEATNDLPEPCQEDRYKWINFCAYDRYGTAEFRIFPGTIYCTEAYRFALIADSIVNWARQTGQEELRRLLKETRRVPRSERLRGKPRLDASREFLAAALATADHEMADWYKESAPFWVPLPGLPEFEIDGEAICQ